MANTFELIASSTVGSGGAANIDFTSIPSTYTDLVMKVSVRERSTSSSVCYFTFNNDSANRTERKLQGNGSAASSSSSSDFQLIASASTDTANTFSNAEVYIPNYAGTTNKAASSDSTAENNSSTAFMRLTAHLWSSTAAINRITITTGSNLAQYSTAYLYGVKNA